MPARPMSPGGEQRSDRVITEIVPGSHNFEHDDLRSLIQPGQLQKSIKVFLISEIPQND